MQRLAIPLVVLALLMGACGDDDGSGAEETADDAVTAVDAAADATVVAAVLPEPCVLPPYTATVERTGPTPAGSATFEVVDAVVLPIPIVPDPDREIEDQDELFEAAADTDLLAYSIVIADEDIDGASVGLYSGYEPEGDGKLRAFVSIFPSSPAPIAVGDVITYATDTEIGTYTPFPTIGLDLKASADEFNQYQGDVEGQVRVLALSDDAACFDVDLTSNLVEDVGTVTIRGIFTGEIVARSDLPLN